MSHSGGDFVPTIGRSRLHGATRKALERHAPWLLDGLRRALAPYNEVRARRRLVHRVRSMFPADVAERVLYLHAEARARWDAGETTAVGSPVQLPLGGGTVSVRPGTTDVILYVDIVVHEQYGHAGLDHPRVIVDAGANVGIASAYFLENFPSARLIALEPDPDNASLCRSNLARFGPRAKVLSCALWGSPARLALAPELRGTWAAHVAPIPSGEIEGVTVPALLAQEGIERLDLLKIDIEGAELDVFGAGLLDWMDRVDCIQIELETAEADALFHRVARERGFQLARYREVTIARRYA